MPFFDVGLASLSAPLPHGHRREFIAPGNVGTAQTIHRMQELVSHGKRDFRVRKLAIRLIRDCPNKDYLCFARRLYEYCTHTLKYVFDPNGVELIETPWAVIEAGGGDCDSLVVVLAAMLENIGLACRYVTIKADARRPSEFSHVYLECRIPKQGWIGLDPTMPDKPFGWRPSGKFSRKNWPASKDSAEVHDGDAMAGLGMNDIPYLELTPGVAVGNEWNWRPEAALSITRAPETIELLTRGSSPEPHQREEEFLQKEQITALFDKARASGPPVMQRTAPAPTRGLGVRGFLPWLVLGGVAVWMWRRAR